jgi:hypothetical protein
VALRIALAAFTTLQLHATSPSFSMGDDAVFAAGSPSSLSDIRSAWPANPGTQVGRKMGRA